MLMWLVDLEQKHIMLMWLLDLEHFPDVFGYDGPGSLAWHCSPRSRPRSKKDDEDVVLEIVVFQSTCDVIDRH